MTRLWDFASYNLWSLFSPPVGKEHWHCDMKRGFTKARKKEPQVKALLDRDNTWQRIGILAQQGVYGFHQHPQFLHQPDGVDRVADILQLSEEAEQVRERVMQALRNYQNNPILADREIVELNRGDEGFPEPIVVCEGRYRFNLYAAIDCIFREPDGTLHILDLKTGKSDFDRRQAYVYLLACRYRYRGERAAASFYNLETQERSRPISATGTQLKAIRMELARISKIHQDQLREYRWEKKPFERLYPANPGWNCQYCPFESICQFADREVSA